ncbi:MAG: pilin [Succinivibrionaceae bacterium]
MIVIAIIGILAAIAMPAYSKYMARARFTEVTNATAGVQKQVELCIFDLGASNATTHTANAPVVVDVTVNNAGCSNTAANSGQGWRLNVAADYATKFVDNIAVDANGVITATAINGNGLNGSNIILTPTFATTADTGAIDWVRATTSTCITADLC